MYKTELAEKLVNLLKKAYVEEDLEPEEDFDFNDDSDVAREFSINWTSLGSIGEAVRDAVQRSIENGMRSGTERDMFKAFESWINDMEIGPLHLLIDNSTKDYFMEKPCYLAVNIHGLVTNLLTQEFLEEVDNNGSFESAILEENDIEDIDNRDYEGYDEDFAVESFEDALDDALDYNGAKNYE